MRGWNDFAWTLRTGPRAGLAGLCLGLVLMLGPGDAAAQIEVDLGNTTLHFEGRVHPYFAHSSVGDGPGATFRVRRAWLTVGATLNRWISGQVQHDFSGVLKDTYVRLTVGPRFAFDAGHFKRAFDLFLLQSVADINVIERDGRIPGLDQCKGVGGICLLTRFTSDLEYSNRDVGVRFFGVLGSNVSYQVTLTNGDGLGGDANDAKSGAARVVYELTERVRLGANLSVHDYVGQSDRSEFAGAWGADVEVGSYETEGTHLQVGLVGGDNWRTLGSTGNPSTFRAMQGIVSYHHPIGPVGPIIAIEPLGRISWGDPDLDAEADGGLLLTPGLMAFFAERNKAGINIDIYRSGLRVTEWSLKTQWYFYF